MRRHPLISLIVTAALWLPAGLARAEVSPEYKFKAAVLFNFAKFVEWPTNTFADGKSSIVVGVLGDNPFDTALDEVVAGRTIGHRPLVVQRAQRLEDLKGCHVLFICRSEQSRTARILAQLDNQPVLTVSDTDDFLDAGGGIQLMIENQKPRFEVNAGVTERVGLKIDAQLLSLAKAVRKGEH